jgi:hypothetical protein
VIRDIEARAQVGRVGQQTVARRLSFCANDGRRHARCLDSGSDSISDPNSEDGIDSDSDSDEDGDARRLDSNSDSLTRRVESTVIAIATTNSASVG